MRLTLRTLLAYLDDTLPPSEIKEIGEKVAESDAAQELIARLKAVTRRRRLTAPPTTGPGGLDPNRVAEYLDNELGSEELAELEKLALESDIHLAEIAACHQILTLVLGEPALVPPTARERMYGLVHGREAIPFRKAAPVKPPAEAGEEDEALGLGGGWLRWVLPVAGVLLVVALGLAIYQVLPSKDNSRTASNRRTGEPEVLPVKEKDQDKNNGKANDITEKDKTKGKVSDSSTTEKSSASEKGKQPEQDPAVVERATPPLKDRVSAGFYAGASASDQPSILVNKKADGEGWQRVKSGTPVYTADTLVALPGYTAVVGNKSKGVVLTLRGHVREFTLYPETQSFLGESAVVLHKNDKFDLDITLLRGRIYLRNNKEKGEVKVRLRFHTEVWDLTLESRGTELGVDLIQLYGPGKIDWRTDEPYAQALLCLFQGELGVTVDAFITYNMEADPPKEKLMKWNSSFKTEAPQGIDKTQAQHYWDKLPPSPDLINPAFRDQIKDMTTALKSLELLSRDKVIDVALRESLEKQEIGARKLAIYCLGAIDDLSKLIEVLGDENPEHFIDRDAATHTLRRWVSGGSGQYKRLYNAKTGSGALIGMKFRKGEAETIVELLFNISPENWSKTETFEALSRCLAHRRTAIAQLGYFHLVQLARNAKLPPGFNAAAPQDDRERYAKQIDDMIAKNQLPPPRTAPKEASKGDKR
jgi:hypothetical protein